MPTETPRVAIKDSIEGEGADNSSAPAASETRARVSLAAAGALWLIEFYQRWISPGLPPSCRFYPSCSRYTYGAIERFGLWRGLILGAHRVCRCHPWHPGGVDEVPDKFALWNKSTRAENPDSRAR